MQQMAKDEPMFPFKETQGSVRPPLPLPLGSVGCLSPGQGGVLHRGLPKQLAMPSGSPRSPQPCLF